MGSLTTTLLSLDAQLAYLNELELQIQTQIADISSDSAPNFEFSKKSKKPNKSITKLIGLELNGTSLEYLLGAIDKAQRNKLFSEEITIQAITLLKLTSNRSNIFFQINKNSTQEILKYVLEKIHRAQKELIEKQNLAPYHETLQKAVSKDVKDTSRALTIIGIKTILFVDQKGLENTKSAAYAVMRHYHFTLYCLVQNDLKSQVKSERLIFWLEVLQEHHQAGDINSVVAIYSAIDSLRVELNEKFNKLKREIKAIDEMATKHYQELIEQPLKFIQFYEKNTVIVPFTGSYESRFNYVKEGNCRSQNVVNLFNFFIKETNKAELEIIIKTYAKEPEQAKELLKQLIKKIPLDKLQDFLPAINTKTTTELQSDLENEFTSAVLHSYRTNLISLERLERLVEKEQQSIKANNKALTQMISTFEHNMQRTQQHWESYSSNRSVRPIIESIDLAYIAESDITGHKNKKETSHPSLGVPYSFFGLRQSRSYDLGSNPLSDEAEASSSAPNQTPKSV